MYRIIFNISILILIHLDIYSQGFNNNIVISSNDSVKFNININGFQQNKKPHNNIKVTNLKAQSISLHLIINDSTKQNIKKQIYFEKSNMETTANIIHQDLIYKFRYVGEVNIGVSAIDSNQLAISYHENTPYNDSNMFLIENTIDTIQNDSVEIETVKYKGSKGCNQPLNSVEPLIKIIDAELFSDEKLKLAKTNIKENCIRTLDLKLIIEKFEYEDHKLELALYAFAYTYDIDNYNEIMKLLDFDSSKKTLQDYIETQ